MTIWRFCAVTAVVLLLVYGVQVLDAVSINFLFGTAAAFMYTRRRTFMVLQKPFAALAALAAPGATALPFAQDYGVLQSLLVFPVFMCALYSNSFFALLSRPFDMRRKGSVVPKGLYLFRQHSIVLRGLNCISPPA
ncbi:hypothetical protein V4C53_23860 [Paraburkholderia azotifigens]|uniref:hypothetical protein n=1 Tax=Paraburkholderia azotifigens TaxID=2057004 RepID=UPI003173C58D